MAIVEANLRADFEPTARPIPVRGGRSAERPGREPWLTSAPPQHVARAVARETMSRVRPVLALDRALALRREPTSGTGRAAAVRVPGVGGGAIRAVAAGVAAGMPSSPAIARSAAEVPGSLRALAMSVRADRRVTPRAVADPATELGVRPVASRPVGSRPDDAGIVVPRSVAARSRALGATTVTGARFLSELATQPVDPVTPLPPRYPSLA